MIRHGGQTYDLRQKNVESAILFKKDETVLRPTPFRLMSFQ